MAVCVVRMRMPRLAQAPLEHGEEAPLEQLPDPAAGALGPNPCRQAQPSRSRPLMCNAAADCMSTPCTLVSPALFPAARRMRGKSSPVSCMLVWPAADCLGCRAMEATARVFARHGSPVLRWRFCWSSKGVGMRVGPGVLPATRHNRAGHAQLETHWPTMGRAAGC